VSGVVRWLAGSAALSLVACQMISGLDDLEADRKKTNSVEEADASTDAGDDRQDAGEARDAGEAGAAGGGGRSAAGSAAAGRGGVGGASGAGSGAGAGAASGAGAGGSAGAGGGLSAVCKPPVSGGVCDPVSQCGCGPTENCTFYQGKLACVSQGTAAPYSGCNDDPDCARGYQCVSSVCERSCSGPTDTACGESARCRQLTFDGQPISGDYACTRNCNPAHPQVDDDRFDACPAGMSCDSRGDYSTCAPATATGTSGKLCTDSTECASGFYCSSLNLCEKWCEVGSNDCGAGSTCTGFSAEKAFAGKNIEFGGCCTPPAGKGPCDTSPQCGCPSDQRCDVVLGSTQPDGTTACVPIGTVGPFEPCSSQADCGRGFSCSDRVCKILCDTARPDSCKFYAQTSACTSVLVNGVEVPGWGVCTEVCNPAAPFTESANFAACTNGTTCRHLGDGVTDCRRIPDPTVAIGTQGSSCDNGAGSADGLRCAPAHFCDIDTLKCTQYCEVGGAATCPGGTTCRQFTPPTRIGAFTLGFCL
jgi:hypothetical protein